MSFFDRLLLAYLGYTLPPGDRSFFQRAALAYLGYTAGGNALQTVQPPEPPPAFKYVWRNGGIRRLYPDGTIR